jgi:hypothetical protein
MFAHRALILALAGGLLAAPAAFATDDQDYFSGEMLAYQCRAMAAQFDAAVASAPAGAATQEAKAIRADAGADCFGMQSSADNVSIGIAKMGDALGKVGLPQTAQLPPKPITHPWE